MKKLFFMLALIFVTTNVYAEKWICYENVTEGATTYDKIVKRVVGDCIKKGICTGPNNTGLNPGCFEAEGSEWADSANEYSEVIITNLNGDRVKSLSQGKINDINSARATTRDQELRSSSKAAYDGAGRDALIFKALVSVLIDEINLLRQEIVDISNESQQITDRTLAPRTLSQAKNAIKNKIDSGSVDAD